MPQSKRPDYMAGRCLQWPGHAATMNAQSPLCSIVIVNFNGGPDLQDCLSSLRRQTLADFEVLLVDNASADGSPEWVEAHFPEVQVVRSTSNAGFAAAVNTGFRRARGRFLVTVNADTEADPGWLAALVAPLQDRPRVGLSTSRICYFDDRDRVNTCGNEVHVSGFGFCRGLDRPAREYDQSCRVTSVSGCAFAMHRDVFEVIGGLDDDFFLYVEETDLSLRAALAGYEIWYAADSIVYHKYELRMQPGKFFLLERNRNLTLLKNLRPRTVMMLLPALLPVEMLMWVYAAMHGPAYLGAKVRAHRWFFQNRSMVADKRSRTQALRQVEDATILRLLNPRLPLEQVLGGPPGARALAGVTGVVFGLLSLPARRLSSGASRRGAAAPHAGDPGHQA